MSKRKNVIFCIHGNSTSSVVYDCIINNDIIQYDVVAPNLPGHANNFEKGLDYEFSFKDFKAFLYDKIIDLDANILLVGNSFGGHLAIELSNMIGDNIKGLVILGTPPVTKPVNFSVSYMPNDNLNIFLTESPSASEIISTFNNLLINKKNVPLMVQEFNATHPKVRKSVVDSLHNGEFEDQYKIFTKLNARKYILSGDKDNIVNRNYLNKCKDNSINYCEIVKVDDYVHFPNDIPNDFPKIIARIAKEVFEGSEA